MSQLLPDVQNLADSRGKHINEVGVHDVHYPIVVPMRDGSIQHTPAVIGMTVALAPELKGTHMSRFLEILAHQYPSRDESWEDGDMLMPLATPELVSLIATRLDAEEAFIDLRFPLFLRKKSPVTGLSAMMRFDAIFQAVGNRQGQASVVIGVEVLATSLCPCSKEISEYGAHNQRSQIRIKAQPSQLVDMDDSNFIWFENLIDIAEASASCALFPILKREDEKWVTEQAYNNPRFVEDILRECALRMPLLGDLSWYRIESTNHESIHHHNAYGRIEHGRKDPRFSY